MLKKENKNKNTKPFYRVASDLLKLKIKTIEDVKKFYIGVNDLASQISSNSVFINELSSPKYNDNLNLLKGINYILGYGQMAGRSGLFAKKSLKKVNLDCFLEKNPQAKSEIKNIQKKATLYFKAIKKAIDSYSKEEVDKILENFKKEFDEKLEKIKEARDIKISPQAEKEFSMGPLKYKYPSIFYNDSRLELKPQLVKLCRLFMERSHKTDSFVSDDSIREAIMKEKPISLDNEQKLVSKLRRVLVGKNKLIKIKRVNNEGYTFIAQNIR